MVQSGSDLDQPDSFFGRKDDMIPRNTRFEQFDLELEETDLRIVSSSIGVAQQGQERMKPSCGHNGHFFKNGLEGSIRGARHFGSRPSGVIRGQIRDEGRNVLHEIASKRMS